MVIIIHIGSQREVISNTRCCLKVSFELKLFELLKVFNAGVIAINFMKWSTALTLSRHGETPPLFITTPLAPVGPLWPKVFVGPKNPAVGPEEAPTRHDQALEVTVETRLSLARTSMPAFGPTVETRLLRFRGGCLETG